MGFLATTVVEVVAATLVGPKEEVTAGRAEVGEIMVKDAMGRTRGVHRGGVRGTEKSMGLAYPLVRFWMFLDRRAFRVFLSSCRYFVARNVDSGA